MTVTDSQQKEPIECEMEWAWISKKRKKKTSTSKSRRKFQSLSCSGGKKKRSKQKLLKRCNSPDILNRSSHDLVSRSERMRASEENLRSPRYSEPEGDYAPVSTERWIIRDSQGNHLHLGLCHCSNS